MATDTLEIKAARSTRDSRRFDDAAIRSLIDQINAPADHRVLQVAAAASSEGATPYVPQIADSLHQWAPFLRIASLAVFRAQAIREEREREALAAEFRSLADRWLDGTYDVSDVTEIVMHPDHLRIIGLGPRVIPFVFAELQREPAMWFWALEALTGECPVPDGVTDMQSVVDAWLEYGRGKGYI